MGTRPLRRSRWARRRLSVETLEPRLLMDAAGKPAAELVDDAFDVHQNGAPRLLDVLANDVFGPDYAGRRRITSVSYGSEGGRIEIPEDRQAIEYAPPADFFGLETFVYYVDGRYSATVTVTATSPLTFDEYELPPDGEARVLDVLANDAFWSNYDGPREITSVSQTSLGSELAITDDGKSLIYTPPADAYGKDAADAYSKDAFVYVVDDLYSAQVKINIPNPLEEDHYPGIVQNSEHNVLDVLANDPFWSGYAGARRITFVTEPTGGGTLTIVDDGATLAYAPAADFCGAERFTYVVDNRYEASVSLHVHRPVEDDSYELDVNSTGYLMTLTANDVFSYRDNWGWITCDVIDRITSVGETTHGGIVEITEDGQGVRYSAPEGFLGTDTFEYVADGRHRATVRVLVTPPVRDDWIRDDRIRDAVYEDTVDNVLPVLRNDFEGNGYNGPGIITSVSKTSAGSTVTIAADGKSLLYAPAPGFRGRDTLSYTVDGQFQADVKIDLAALAQRDTFTFYPDRSGSELVLHVLSNDHFSSHYAYESHYPGPGIITAVSETANGGCATIAQDGKSIRFTSAEGGADRFTYTVDGTYEASVSVAFYNCLRTDSFVVDQNSVDNKLSPLGNDFEHWRGLSDRLQRPYEGPGQITSVSAREGTVTIAADGKTLCYWPAPDFVGNDQLTYTVDGMMQETIAVHVVRRVRDDVFHVETDSQEDALPVLVNDLFGADYTGAGRITGVTETEMGGLVRVSANGTSIRYTPPAGFAGRDRFTYVVDGRLKAQVVVSVGELASDLRPRFDSREALEQFLLDDALGRYDNLFGQESSVIGSDPGTSGYLTLSFSQGDGATADSRSHSETNVQVAGVDEGDVVENDGDYLYILTGGEAIIASAWPAEEMAVVSRLSVEGTPIAEYLNGDRLTVISRIRQGRAETLVTVIDVSDRTSPKILERTMLDGTYVESRRIDDFVFLVLRKRQSVFHLPGPIRIAVTDSSTAGDGANDDLGTPSVIEVTPELWPNSISDGLAVVEPEFVEYGAVETGLMESGAPLRFAPATSEFGLLTKLAPTTYVYESREQYVERMKAEMTGFFESKLPCFASYGPDGALVASGLLVQPEAILRPRCPGSDSLVSVVSLNTSDDRPGIAASTGILTSGASEIYGSLDNLYVFEEVHTVEDGATTEIVQFDWDAETGEAVLAAKGQVPGRMFNQFSADEYDGHLRIATTISNAGSGNWSGRSENVLFVLRSDGGVLETVGGLQNLALDESIRSVRFLGQRAFVTTFRDVDPMFALDLSDPAHPCSRGHITMPGYNSYMQPIDATHILAVGRNTPIGGTGPTQVTLFDVQDLSQPRIVDSYTFERFSTSEAETDHHAFGWFAEHQVLAMPTARSFRQRVDEDGDGHREARIEVREDGLLLFKIDVTAARWSGDGIQLLGEVEHQSPVRRSGFIEDVLYSIADDSIQAVSIVDPTVRLAEVDLSSPPTPVPPPPAQPVDSPVEETPAGPGMEQTLPAEFIFRRRANSRPGSGVLEALASQARDAVLTAKTAAKPHAPNPSPARIAWLYDYEPFSSRRASGEDDQTKQMAVDSILANPWYQWSG
ncbi:MAG: hypothetical protein A2V70_08955 [Planctomycetes bacterium RBG_13_63_9]|nr:MAG: hypothetical protein A2V70_08955 [Planctomycetes bacterium RBG_13_63_9]